MEETAPPSTAFSLPLLLSAPTPAAAGEAGARLPQHTQRFSDRIVLARAGDRMQSIRVAAFSTAPGIVAIGVNLIHSADAGAGQAIEQESRYFRDRILAVRGMDVRGKNVEAIREELASRRRCVAAVSIPAIQASQFLQVLLILGLPPCVGWLFFQGPMLTRATGEGFTRALLLQLPRTWVAANLGMSGINVLAMPLVNLSVRTCPVLPLSPWTVAAWWAIAAGTALVGGPVLLPYESWAARRGYRAWMVAAAGEGEGLTPPWQKVWWWLPLSLFALVAGVAAGVLILRAFSG